MNRIGVAGLITSDGPHSFHLLLGRRGKDPNRGLFVLPGGGVQDNETLEKAFRREILEETGCLLQDNPYRWHRPDLIELSDRLILVVQGKVLLVDGEDTPTSGSDLYDVAWFNFLNLPPDISPVVIPTFASWGFKPGKGN